MIADQDRRIKHLSRSPSDPQTEGEASFGRGSGGRETSKDTQSKGVLEPQGPRPTHFQGLRNFLVARLCAFPLPNLYGCT